MNYAHINKSGKYQTVSNHLENVAKLSGELAKDFGAENTAYICGMLHDVGKCSREFQNRLLNNGPKVDHSTAGAIEAGNLYGGLFKIVLGYIICGHHSGLMDYGSEESGLKLRFNKEIPKYESEYIDINIDVKELTRELPKKMSGHNGFTLGFYIRMVYSCLVDADFLDTEEFMDIAASKKRKDNEEFSVLNKSFKSYMERKNGNSSMSKINSYRREIYKDCIKAASQGVNLFSLTVPTGGGKTLSSMAFALRHLKHNNLKKIICVIPYTSIIEQNAKQYKDIFGEENVLEHHSNFDFSEVKKDTDSDWGSSSKKSEYTLEKLKYASENWDIPIIVTTNIQFFESLFANKSSRCRKIHNMSNSIVIIDEAQMMPTKFLKPTLNALTELVNNYNTSVVLTTATKPEFPKDILKKKPKEIIDEPEKLYDELKRVKVNYLGKLSDENLVERIDNLERVLVVVNTRKHAEKLYEKADKNNLFHLSANMCPAHRSELLKEIKRKLKNGEPCKIISTQLIECGVDISLSVVYRSLSGIDSIAQVAGRCNREWEVDLGQVYVFESTEGYGKAIMYQSRTAECGRQILEQFEDPLSLQAISKYFELLYDTEKDRLDTKNIMDNFEERAKELAFLFKKTAKDYKLIDETESLIIPYNDDANKLIQSLKYSEYPNTIARKLQKYTINIHKNKLDELTAEGVIININNQFMVLAYREGFYDKRLGLCSKNKEMLII
ncbi:CRISPR-associated helicase Cas3' [Clostridium sp.]|uniref:CRISPR-associated helicase Cas3' n=1 Tax=Clostridium sp. TaxID=1506 RepID=UPI0035A0F95A